jgi:hypothetical protein
MTEYVLPPKVMLMLYDPFPVSRVDVPLDARENKLERSVIERRGRSI